jgi:hypothetical protein
VDLASHIHELVLPGIQCGRRRHELGDGRKNRLDKRRLPGLSVTSLMLGTKVEASKQTYIILYVGKPKLFCMLEKDSSE